MPTQAHNAWLERVFGITLPQSVKDKGSAIADGADKLAKAGGIAPGTIGIAQGAGGTIADQVEQLSNVPLPMDPISSAKQAGQVINYLTDKNAPLDSIAPIRSLEQGANLANDVVHYEMADPTEQMQINERVDQRIIDKVKETGQEIAQDYDDAEAQGPDGRDRFFGKVTGKIGATVALGFLGEVAPEAKAASDVLEGAEAATEEGAEGLADDALQDPATADDAEPNDDGSGDDDQSGDDTLVDQKAVDDPLIDQDPVDTDDADPDDDGSGDDDQSGDDTLLDQKPVDDPLIDQDPVDTDDADPNDDGSGDDDPASDGEPSGDDESEDGDEEGDGDESEDGDEEGDGDESEDHDEHAGHIAAHGLGEAAAHVVVEQVKDVAGAAVGDDDEGASGDNQDDAGDDGDDDGDDDNDDDDADADDAKKTS